jgi:hypothetical protein
MVVLRALRVLLPLAIVLAIVAAGVSIFTARPDIQRARKDVNQAWSPLSTQLQGRYQALENVDKQLLFFGGPVHQLAAQVETSLGSWRHAISTNDVSGEVRAANDLEALGRRLVASARQSPQVKANEGVVNEVDVYAGDESYAGASAFNAAVASYEKERQGPIRGIVAAMLRDDDVPAFSPAPITAST